MNTSSATSVAPKPLTTTDATVSSKSIPTEPSTEASAAKVPSNRPTSKSDASSDKYEPLDALDEMYHCANKSRAARVPFDEIMAQGKATPKVEFDMEGMPEFLASLDEYMSNCVTISGKYFQSLERLCKGFTTHFKSPTQSPIQVAAANWLEMAKPRRRETVIAHVALRRLQMATMDPKYAKVNPRARSNPNVKVRQPADSFVLPRPPGVDEIVAFLCKMRVLDKKLKAARQEVIKEHSKVYQCSLPFCLPVFYEMPPGFLALDPPFDINST